MNANDILAFEHHLNVVASDPALLGSFSARYPSLISLFGQFAPVPVVTLPGPFPAISNMTAIQTTLFDNWGGEKPVKNHPNRYGMAIEVWTAECEDIRVGRKGDYQHKGNVQLLTPAELAKRVVRIRSSKLRNPIPADYADALLQLASDHAQTPNTYIGLVGYKSPAEGTFYHPYQFAFVTLSGTNADVVLVVDGATVALPWFDNRLAGGGEFKGNAILQSRADRCGFSTHWAT